MDGELGFQVSDAPPGRLQLSPLTRRQPRLESSVDTRLTSPVVHGLIADAKVARDITHTPPCGEQIKNPSSKLRRVAASGHAVLLVRQQHDIPVIRLHKTQGALFDTGFGVAWFAGTALMGVLYQISISGLVIFSVLVQLMALVFFTIAGFGQSGRGTGARAAR